MDHPVNINLDPEDALRVLLSSGPLVASDTVEPVDEDTDEGE